MKITPGKFETFYREKGASQKCPFCGNVNWSAPVLSEEPKMYEDDEEMIVQETAIPLMADAASNEIKLNAPVIPVIALTCIQCGFVRYQHVLLLKQWLNGQGEKQ